MAEKGICREYPWLDVVIPRMTRDLLLDRWTILHPRVLEVPRSEVRHPRFDKCQIYIWCRLDLRRCSLVAPGLVP